MLSLPIGASAAPVTAVPTSDFLNSLGINTTFPNRGQPIDKTIEMVNYCGIRWVRAGIEGLTENGPTTIKTYLELHEKTGAKLSFGLGSGGTNIQKLVDNARILADADALLAFEGNNEPNNWGVTYQDEKGGGKAPSWMAVANLQRDMYAAVKGDPKLAKYPVWSISEPGAERDNVGLQFLTIPEGAGTLMPGGTKYADAANVHNYVYHPNSKDLIDNRTWMAADPSKACKVDGLYGNFGVTWAKKFKGYSDEQLQTLPRVTTETGCTIGGVVTEQIQALNLLSLYLDQFKRGYSYTSPYILRDRTDEGGNQTFGFYDRNYKPRKAAMYLHNLTTILTDKGNPAPAGKLDYTIQNQPETVHDLLLQHSDGRFQLIIWGERVKGEDKVTVKLDRRHKSITVFDPTVGTELVSTIVDTDSFELMLSDHPLVLVFDRE